MKNVEMSREMRIKFALQTCGDVKIVFWDVGPFMVIHVQVLFILLRRPRRRRGKNIKKNLQ
jgi:hypothetical protein